MPKLVGLVLLLNIALINSLPIVDFSDGKIEGREFKIDDEKNYVGFVGIPYAEPPIGQLRFKDPIPKQKFDNVLKSPVNATPCVQADGQGSEDCLFLNIFTPDISCVNLPVMVWIHGGAFVSGSSNEFTPKYFMEDGGVMIVTLNYRLNVFGFLSTGDSVVSGNMGLKDQIMALKWVQKHIESFGGNPDEVTIFGQSAGSASVSYLLQSPLSKGLFHRAIMQSGTSLCQWALDREARKVAFDLGEKLKVNTSTSESLVEGLRNVSAKELKQAESGVYMASVILSNALQGLAFVPVKEPESETAAFSEKSHKLLFEGKFHRVPVIIGHNSLEAVFVNDLPGASTAAVIGTLDEITIILMSDKRKL